jgi:hypothetical protein
MTKIKKPEHVCKPETEGMMKGYCGDSALICKECGHRGMNTTWSGTDDYDTATCPRCGHQGELHISCAPGTRV